MKRTAIFLLLLLLLSTSLAACGQPTATALNGTADNEIVSFCSNLDNRPIIRVGCQYYTPDNSLYLALQERFPDYLFVFDYGAAAGVLSETRLVERLQQGESYDLLLSGNIHGLTAAQPQLFVDLSAEAFLDNYLLTALNDVSVDGHIYTVPGVSSLAGIAYNADLFARQGWSVPQTHEQFLALCDRIAATGITPFTSCCKYSSALTRMLTSMTYAQLFESVAGVEWLAGLGQGRSRFDGYLQPLYQLAADMRDHGALQADFFTASLTRQRQDFWAGATAMIEYESTIFDYASAEQAPFAVGIMPYPAHEAEEAGFAVSSEYYLSIPATVQQDEQRLALMLEILAYLSTNAGQQAVLANSPHISNVKGVDLGDNPAAKYVQQAYARGDLYPLVLLDGAGVDYYGLLQASLLQLVEGETVQQALAAADAQLEAQLAAAAAPSVAAPPPQVVARAEQDFTVLETSYYLADKLAQASGAPIALMLNNSFFRANLTAIKAGDITDDLSRFVMKGVGADDYLTSYSLSGAQLRALLERPIVNGAELDACFAASGLVIEYAPWNERGSRLLSVSLADGTPIADEQQYTVAAWAGVIDEQYISQTLQLHEQLGSLTDILLAALIADQSISPDIRDRLTLVWPAAAE